MSFYNISLIAILMTSCSVPTHCALDCFPVSKRNTKLQIFNNFSQEQ